MDLKAYNGGAVFTRGIYTYRFTFWMIEFPTERIWLN